MEKIYTSASRLVFIALAITACAGFFVGNLSQENFMILVGVAFTYYFTKKKEGK
jgi:hypothetical protein